MSIISMTLADEGIRLRYMLIFLLAHYIVDATVLGYNIRTRREETGYGHEFNRVLSWLISNAFFCGVFAICVYLDIVNTSGVAERWLFRLTIAIWLANSIINLSITYFFRDRLQYEPLTSPGHGGHTKVLPDLRTSG